MSNGAVSFPGFIVLLQVLSTGFCLRPELGRHILSSVIVSYVYMTSYSMFLTLSYSIL